MLLSTLDKFVLSNDLVITHFSRISAKFCDKVRLSHGARTWTGATTRKANAFILMAQRKRDDQYSESSNPDGTRDSGSSHRRSRVGSHLSGVQSKRKEHRRRSQDREESIKLTTPMVPSTTNSSFLVVNPYASFTIPNFAKGQCCTPLHHAIVPLLHPQANVIYHNFFCPVTLPVLKPSLSNRCFHSQGSAGQCRALQTKAEKSYGDPTINGLRSWITVAEQPKTNQFTFSVMSYNVLAQELIDQHQYLYNAHIQEDLNWEDRWKRILGEIMSLDPDILCLQEVQESHIPRYFSLLKSLGYDGVYKKRTGLRPDGCAIYYKPALVKLVEHTTIEFNQPNVPILNRDNVGIIARFAPKKHSSEEFIVATTHLLYNPKRQDVRLAQVQLLLAEVDRLAFHPKNTQNPYLPTIVTGDLNSKPNSAIYQFMTKGELKYEHLLRSGFHRKTLVPAFLRITDQCQHANIKLKRDLNKMLSRKEEVQLIELWHSDRKNNNNPIPASERTDSALFSSGTLTHNFCLQSVYKHHVNGDIEGTTYQEEWTSVDYIFYSNGRNSSKLKLLARYNLPTSRQLGRMKIPDKNLGSDHLSLLAKFSLKV